MPTAAKKKPDAARGPHAKARAKAKVLSRILECSRQSLRSGKGLKSKDFWQAEKNVPRRRLRRSLRPPASSLLRTSDAPCRSSVRPFPRWMDQESGGDKWTFGTG
jgi:hypothetical protein